MKQTELFSVVMRALVMLSCPISQRTKNTEQSLQILCLQSFNVQLLRERKKRVHLISLTYELQLSILRCAVSISIDQVRDSQVFFSSCAECDG